MHSYKVRPGYRSDKLLIEFGPSSSDEQFIADLKALFAAQGCRKRGAEDIVFLVTTTFDSPSGLFQLDHDEWGFVFLHADGNQAAIHYLDKILQSSGRFKREHVHFRDYAQPGAAPYGGPTTPLANTDAEKEPPSVS